MRDIARLDDYRTDRPTPVAESDPEQTATPGGRLPTGVAPDREPGRIAPPPSSAPEPLWREALGERLRAHRAARSETLTRTADRAGVSPQYLSEMERGLKEPSSEMIAAVAGALGLSLPDLVADVARHLAQRSAPVRSRALPPTPQLRAA